MKTAIDSQKLENAAHLLNSARSAIEELCEKWNMDKAEFWSEKDEGQFWDFLDQLPKHMQESVVN